MENENVCCFECGSRNINRDFGDSRSIAHAGLQRDRNTGCKDSLAPL